jgi:SnoaL-like domain
VTREQLDGWLSAYGAAWEERDGERAAALFAEDGLYWWGPLQPPLQGRQAIAERWTQATDGQRDVAFRHEVLGVDGVRGFSRWWSSFDQGGSRFELDGVFVLDFGEDGLCTQLQEWWAATETPVG